ncbi:NAD(P)-dependent oxidoreductase [Mesorhizobium sp. M0130]|uniref:NAD(P)-dependent oxidoreductase n=1 Tax=Mesorhizobium sp. M0130 TaxID=2956887 RepID=UPI0033377AF4
MSTRQGYAFIGLGHLGGQLAASLIRNGFAVSVYDRDPAAVECLVLLGAEAANSPADAAARAGNAITCLASPKVSEAVLAGPDGLLEGLPSGGSWIEMSTNGQDEIVWLAALASAAGVETLECPVTGGVHLAAVGKITALVGGEAALYARHRPAIEAMCARSFLMGPVGSAAAIKVITNMLAFIHLVAAGEALMLAKKSGLDLAQSYHAIVASSGNSFVHETESQLVLNGSYDIGFRARHGRKIRRAARACITYRCDLSAGQAGLWRQRLVDHDREAARGAVGTELRASGFPAKLEAEISQIIN